MASNMKCLDCVCKSYLKWSVVKGVGSAVDNILKGKKYPAEIRRRDPENPDNFSVQTIMC